MGNVSDCCAKEREKVRTELRRKSNPLLRKRPHKTHGKAAPASAIVTSTPVNASPLLEDNARLSARGARSSIVQPNVAKSETALVTSSGGPGQGAGVQRASLQHTSASKNSSTPRLSTSEKLVPAAGPQVGRASLSGGNSSQSSAPVRRPSQPQPRPSITKAHGDAAPADVSLAVIQASTYKPSTGSDASNRALDVRRSSTSTSEQEPVVNESLPLQQPGSPPVVVVAESAEVSLKESTRSSSTQEYPGDRALDVRRSSTITSEQVPSSKESVLIEQSGSPPVLVVSTSAEVAVKDQAKSPQISPRSPSRQQHSGRHRPTPGIFGKSIGAARERRLQSQIAPTSPDGDSSAATKSPIPEGVSVQASAQKPVSPQKPVAPSEDTDAVSVTAEETPHAHSQAADVASVCSSVHSTY